MKKSLVLAMAMALGVTASAYAANPFSDVPAGHWAYDSVSKLAAAGIVQGYGDTTFGGDKLMTRYEMAEIVAKALAKGANVDKLAAEFADELNALGVRVAKLEKKADNVKIAGTVKYQIKSLHRDSMTKASWDKDKKQIKYGSANNFSRLRSDITLKGAVNEDWTYTALLRNEQRLDKGGKNIGEETTRFQRAYVNGKIGGLAVQAGRYNWTSPAGGDIWDDRVDGVQVSYGKDIKLTGAYMQAANAWDVAKSVSGKDTSEYIYFANLEAKLGKAAKANVAYINFEDLDDEIWNVGLNLNLTKSLALNAQYFHADMDGCTADKDGWTAALSYKGAKAAKAGSWGLMAKYYDVPVAAAIAPGLTYDCAQPATYAPNAKNDGMVTNKDGLKGFQVRAEYALAKGIVGKVAYYDLKGQTVAPHQETLMTEVVFSF